MPQAESEEVILLDAGNGSAEMIVLFLARFLGGLEDAGLLPAGKEAYRLRLSLKRRRG